MSAFHQRQQDEEGDHSMLQLPAALLEEKNLEIDHLNQQIHCLQQELDTSKVSHFFNYFLKKETILTKVSHLSSLPYL